MKKYKIILGGKGAESFVFKVDNEKNKELQELIQTDPEPYMIEGALMIESIDDAQNVVKGVYTTNDYYIDVLDENGERINFYSSEDGWDFDEDELLDLRNEDKGFEFLYDENNILVVETYCKGNFFEFNLEIEEEFNIGKLSPMVSDVGTFYELITGLFYDKVRMDDYEYGDLNIKGFYYHLSSPE